MKLDIPMKSVYSQPSFIFENDSISLALTEMGGHMAPVTFFRNTDAPAQPYLISPWQMERVPASGCFVDMFRGDFFALPFGLGIGGPIHGEPAGSKWTLERAEREGEKNSIILTMDTQSPESHMEKELYLIDGHNAVYIRNSVSGLSGKFTFTSHATLDVNEDRPVVLSSSPTHFGLVCAGKDCHHEPSELTYVCLEGGNYLEDFEHVPTIWKNPAELDCSHLPLPRHFGGALQFYQKAQDGIPAWNCVWFPRENFVWYSLKNVKVQAGTHYWLESGGRFQYPWNGRTLGIAVEEIGLNFSTPETVPFAAPHPDLIERYDECGIVHDYLFRPEVTKNINYIQGAVQVCEDFGKVVDIEFAEGGMTLVSESGNRQYAPVYWQHALED
ncbi:MAG: hypothetical protein IJP17_06165 [Clostridia bacterium]|nr:hypothetical protein [Clostridia bacterium]